MRDGSPSQTAVLVAFARALADEGLTTATGFHDPAARSLLPWLYEVLCARMERWMKRVGPGPRARVAEQVDVVPLRVMAINAELEQAVAAGCRQVVVLGAGLDTRAYYMTALADAEVFEVDHPATQAFKRSKAAALRPVAGRLIYVAVDFERDALTERLAAAGHRADAPTAWVWEGVVMYLTDAALRATLRAAAERSAAGSVLLVHYHEPGAERAYGLLRLALSLLGEPQIGLRTRAAMTAEVARAGFTVEHDTAAADWAARFGANPPVTRIARATRLLAARRP
jgi:methyltransferase (TIGR00027 family)